MSGIAGYNVSVKIGGTPTTLTSAATTTASTVAGTYQINDSTKRILSSTAAVVVKDNGNTVSADKITKINYLFGTVTLSTSYTGSTAFNGSIKISGKYIPTTSVVGAHSYTINQTADLLYEIKVMLN